MWNFQAFDFPILAKFRGANETKLFSIEVYSKYIKTHWIKTYLIYLFKITKLFVRVKSFEKIYNKIYYPHINQLIIKISLSGIHGIPGFFFHILSSVSKGKVTDLKIPAFFFKNICSHILYPPSFWIVLE